MALEIIVNWQGWISVVSSGKVGFVLPSLARFPDGSPWLNSFAFGLGVCWPVLISPELAQTRRIRLFN